MNINELREKLREDNPNYKYIDCLACGHSFSTENDELKCILHDKDVAEDELCENFN